MILLVDTKRIGVTTFVGLQVTTERLLFFIQRYRVTPSLEGVSGRSHDWWRNTVIRRGRGPMAVSQPGNIL